MSVSLDCSGVGDVSKPPEQDDREGVDNSLRVKIQKLACDLIGGLDGQLEMCKHGKHRPRFFERVVANTRSSFVSIVAGSVLVGLGLAISLASPAAGSVVIGIGAGLITNAVTNEINEASEDKKEPTEKPSSPQIEYGGDIVIGIEV